MNNSTKAIANAMENAAISGLCREGQLEIGVQEARKLHPEKNGPELYALVCDIYEISMEEL